MVRAAVPVTLALAYVSSCVAFSLTPEASFRSSSLGLRRSATIARPRLQLGRLHAQMQPEHEHEHKTSEQPKFGWAAHNAAWQNFVRTAQEGWNSGAQDRASSSLPSIFLVPVWVGVAAMGLFLPAPQLLESILVGMSHGAEASNAVDLHSVASAVTGVSAAYAGKHVEHCQKLPVHNAAITAGLTSRISAAGTQDIFSQVQGGLQGGLDMIQLSNPQV